MTSRSRLKGRAPALADRENERGLLDSLVGGVRKGQSGVLVIRGDPGVGKTALLDYVAGNASACRVTRIAGVQSEMELAFAGLQVLCTPMLGRIEQLPAPQQEALRTAFGLSFGPPPNPFLVGLAVLSLLTGAAEKRPHICLIDDEQWLDEASAQALGFAARRLAADPVGLIFASRDPGTELDGFPELEIGGLGENDARALLESVVAGPLDTRVRDLIVAETGGNPLALLELPRGLTFTQMAGGFGLPGAVSLARRIEDSFRRQMESLPDQTRSLLLLAAADSSGDPSLVWRAAEHMGIPVQAAAPAVAAALVEFGSRVKFWHPLVRSAVYRSASFEERQKAHRAIAEAIDPGVAPDRRAWHRAQATAGPDEDVAAELERSADQARERGGLAAAAAFLERAAALSVDPMRRIERTLAATEVSTRSGALGRAMELLTAAQTGPLDESASARADLLHGQIAFASGLGSDAPPLLLKAAKRLEPLDLELARETYLSAWTAAQFAGHLASAGDLQEVSGAALTLPPPPGPPSVVDLLLDGLARVVTEGRAAATPALRRAVTAFTSHDVSKEERLRWGWPAQTAAIVLYDEDCWRAIATEQTQLARNVGALDQLPIDLASQAVTLMRSGDLAAAGSLIAEADVVAEATGTGYPPFAPLLLACLSGDEADAVPLIESTIAAGMATGQGHAVSYAQYTAAILYNGLGRYTDALAAARQAGQDPLYLSAWALPELIEAAVRSGDVDTARAAAAREAQMAAADRTDYDLGIHARSRALLSDDEDADGIYREAIERLSRTRLRLELARAYLLHGEWLRRQGRRIDARTQLRTAYRMLVDVGAEAFAERARRELAAVGEGVGKRPPEARSTLTAQEATVARLASDGLTNTEIGSQLFLSARTVEWHLSNVFTKLGITSRRELDRS
ncbi:helix-turn-helix transcriptional regulator [Actinoplanes solisilvae]|uniref:helix-turn-helix transcriptional regulator n=1 Tax=Actinoplanes solisilvae TaxID=2486853 RepID=UPI000FD94CE2|nr:helix-turn-helix transcriptional regulator [Actinoplanes solisilvae]